MSLLPHLLVSIASYSSSVGLTSSFFSNPEAVILAKSAETNGIRRKLKLIEGETHTLKTSSVSGGLLEMLISSGLAG